MLAPPKPPPHDELEALIKEARERQLRRRLLGAAGVAIVAALGLGAYALTIGGRTRSSGTSLTRAGVPPCRSSQLLTSAMFGASGGTTFNPVQLTNTSGRACALPAGTPALQILFRGKPFPIAQQSWRGSLRAWGTPAGRTLAAGKQAFVELRWRDWCPRPAQAPLRGAVTLVLRFDGGLRVTAPQSSPDVPGPALPGCGEVVHPRQGVDISPLLRLR